MHASYPRRTATKIVAGETRRKNRQVPTGHRGYVLDRESPGQGCRHVVTKRQLQDFLDLIPDWPVLSHRLERIVLAAGDGSSDGYHNFYYREETGAIFLCSWDQDLWVQLALAYFEAHRDLLLRLGVSCDAGNDPVDCRFTEGQARAFVLLHVFMHELGHHWDRTHQKGRRSDRGEDYAEAFANRYLEQLLPAYIRTFGDPSKDT
jgi:hypothetical protein